jgi:hypothetical protein
MRRRPRFPSAAPSWHRAVGACARRTPVGGGSVAVSATFAGNEGYDDAHAPTGTAATSAATTRTSARPERRRRARRRRWRGAARCVARQGHQLPHGSATRRTARRWTHAPAPALPVGGSVVAPRGRRMRRRRTFPSWLRRGIASSSARGRAAVARSSRRLGIGNLRWQRALRRRARADRNGGDERCDDAHERPTGTAPTSAPMSMRGAARCVARQGHQLPHGSATRRTARRWAHAPAPALPVGGSVVAPRGRRLRRRRTSHLGSVAVSRARLLADALPSPEARDVLESATFVGDERCTRRPERRRRALRRRARAPDRNGADERADVGARRGAVCRTARAPAPPWKRNQENRPEVDACAGAGASRRWLRRGTARSAHAPAPALPVGGSVVAPRGRRMRRRRPSRRWLRRGNAVGACAGAAVPVGGSTAGRRVHPLTRPPQSQASEQPAPRPPGLRTSANERERAARGATGCDTGAAPPRRVVRAGASPRHAR